MSVTSSGLSFFSSSNNTPSTLPYRVSIKINKIPEEKSNKELPAGIGDDSSYFQLVVDDDLKMGYMKLWWDHFGEKNWK